MYLVTFWSKFIWNNLNKLKLNCVYISEQRLSELGWTESNAFETVHLILFESDWTELKNWVPLYIRWSVFTLY